MNEVVLPDMSEVVMHLEDAVADSVEITKEALVLPKTEANEADDSKEEIANEADDSVQAVADSVGGATRRRGSEAAEAVHQGARVPQRNKAKEKPEVIFYYLKSART